MLITDQVATAPCTDPVQVRFPTFEVKRRDLLITELAKLKLLVAWIEDIDNLFDR